MRCREMLSTLGAMQIRLRVLAIAAVALALFQSCGTMGKADAPAIVAQLSAQADASRKPLPDQSRRDVGGDHHLREAAVHPVQVARAHFQPLAEFGNEDLGVLGVGGGERAAHKRQPPLSASRCPARGPRRPRAGDGSRRSRARPDLESRRDRSRNCRRARVMRGSLRGRHSCILRWSAGGSSPREASADSSHPSGQCRKPALAKANP